MRSAFSALSIMAFLISGQALAAELGQGVESVVADDGHRRYCINASTDQVSVLLNRAVIEKDKGWFSNDTAVDMIVDGKIEKRDPSFNRKKASMPVKFRARIEEYESGTVVVPIDLVILSKYPLRLQENTATLLELDFDFINSTEPTILSRVISRLPDAARGLPLPPSPYSEAFVQATSVLGGVVESMLGDETNQENVSRQGRISLEFNETGQCGRNGAYSGTYVFIKSYEKHNSAGIIRLDDIPKYCFIKFPNMSPIFIERKDNNGKCSFDRSNAVRLLNPHFSLMVSISNITSEARQQRTSLESDMAVKAAEIERSSDADTADFMTVAHVDDFTLTKFNQQFVSTAYLPEDIETPQSSYNLDDQAIKYKIDPTLMTGQSFNAERHNFVDKFPSETMGGIDFSIFDDKNKLDTVPVSDILLNSLARCNSYGLEIYECL